MTSQDYIIVLLGYEVIYGFEGGGIERVRKEVAEYNLYSLLQCASKISIRLFSHGMEMENQIKMTKDIFAKDAGVRQKIVEAVRKTKVPRWAIFAEQPLLNLFKVILENGDKKGGKLVNEEDVQKVGHWLLILSDLCMDSELEAPIVVPSNYQREQLREYLTRQYFFNAQERIPYRLARFKDIFEKIRKLHPEFDIDKKFSDATGGVVLDDYISFCFFLLIKWINLTTKKDDDNRNDWVICKTKYFENTKLTMKEIDSVLPLLLLDVINYKKDYDKTVENLLNNKDIYAFNFLQLRQRPLIPNGECFVCPSPHFFMDKATDGIYWILENYFRKNIIKKDWSLLPSVWGDAFEQYIHERLLGGFMKKYQKNPKIKNEEITDGIIYGKNYIFLIEIKYAHWSYLSRLTGKKEDMLPTLKQLFSSEKKIKGLGQLTKAIKRIENGELALEQNLNKRKIIPVLIVGEGLPMDAYSRKMYEDFAKKTESFYESSITLPFVVLDAEEAEILETIAIKNDPEEAERILSEYSKVFLNRNVLGFIPEALQFKNYLDALGYPTENNPNLFKLFEKIHATAKEKGFPKENKKGKIVA